MKRNKKEKNKGKYVKASVVSGCLFAGFVAALVLLVSVNNVVENEVIEESYDKQLKRVTLVIGDASNVSGETHVSYVMSYPHQASPGTAYATRLVNSSAYEYYDGLNNEMTGETPYDTTFDLVVLVGVNATHGYNSTGSTWEMGWINATMKCTDLSVNSDVACVETQAETDGSTWNYVHYYLQDADGGAGSGFQISHGETFNVTRFEFWAYF